MQHKWPIFRSFPSAAAARPGRLLSWTTSSWFSSSTGHPCERARKRKPIQQTVPTHSRTSNVSLTHLFVHLRLNNEIQLSGTRGAQLTRPPPLARGRGEAWVEHCARDVWWKNGTQFDDIGAPNGTVANSIKPVSICNGCKRLARAGTRHRAAPPSLARRHRTAVASDHV